MQIDGFMGWHMSKDRVSEERRWLGWIRREISIIINSLHTCPAKCVVPTQGQGPLKFAACPHFDSIPRRTLIKWLVFPNVWSLLIASVP
jgi:hypothetical protein